MEKEKYKNWSEGEDREPRIYINLDTCIYLLNYIDIEEVWRETKERESERDETIRKKQTREKGENEKLNER